MNAREYLSQSYRVNQRIYSMLDQIEDLKTLATKISSVTNDMPGSPNRNIHKTENVVVKLLDLEDSVLNEMNILLDLKREMKEVLTKLENIDYRIILEMRYLCYKTWEEIAEDMDYGIRYVHIMHRKALKAVEPFIPEK